MQNYYYAEKKYNKRRRKVDRMAMKKKYQWVEYRTIKQQTKFLKP